MATGHLEIMRTLVGLSKPSPECEIVPFNPVRDKLLELFGSAADHPNLIDCFHIVLSVGGGDSELLTECFNFCAQFVNETSKNFRVEAYGAIANIPVAFPRIKFMLLKTCWATSSSNSDWCIVPPNMQHRFAAPGSKFTWIELMQEVETASQFVSTLVSKILDRDKRKNRKMAQLSKAKWLSEFDIDVCRVLLSAPAKVEGNQLQRQISEKRTELIEVIAKKYGVLNNKYANIRDGDLEHPCPLLTAAMAKYNDEKTTSSSVDSAILEAPQPKVIKFGDDRKPLSDFASVTIAPRAQAVLDSFEIPWENWLSSVVTDKVRQRSIAKSIICMCMQWAYQKISAPIPITIVRAGKRTKVIATEDLEPGELHLPLFFRRDSSVIFPDEDVTRTHHEAVHATVKWLYIPSDYIKDAEGGEDKTITINALILPEAKLPRLLTKPEYFDNKVDVHPFWHIPRSSNIGEGNCDIVNLSVAPIIASDFKSLNDAGATLRPATETLNVELPCIVNAKTIKAHDEIFLAWGQKPKDTTKRKAEAIQTNAFDLIRDNAKKQKRAAVRRARLTK